MSTPVLPPSSHTVAGLDVGGTGMKGVVTLASGDVLLERTWPTPRDRGPVAVVEAVVEAAAELGAVPGVAALGLVVAGAVDEAAGVANWSENIGWRDVPFRRLLEERTNLPVGFGHDVRAGGLAERVSGAARGATDVLFMPIGTGISGAIVVEGKALQGSLIGEIGHLDVGSGRQCACGGIGCLETIATGPSIAQAFTERTGRPAKGSREVFAAADDGDLVAASVIASATDAIAMALASYVSLLDPQIIIVGGGVSNAGERLLQPVRSALRARLPWQRMPDIVTAVFGSSAASMGACLLARNVLSAHQSATGHKE